MRVKLGDVAAMWLWDVVVECGRDVAVECGRDVVFLLSMASMNFFPFSSRNRFF